MKKAKDLFHNGRNCAQAVLLSMSNLDENTALKISSAFGGGICGRQDICGAVSGAIMAIGMAHFDPMDQETCKSGVYAKSKAFMGEFQEKFGSLNCIDLLGVDTSTEEGKQKKENLSEEICEEIIEWVENRLDDYL